MRRLRWLGMAMVVLCLTGCSGKDTKGGTPGVTGSSSTTPPREASNAEKIVGTWEGAKGQSKDVTLVFDKDGKVKTSHPKEPGMEGTYKVDGETLELNMKEKGRPATLQIKSLTDTTLILVEKGKEDEFKKK